MTRAHIAADALSLAVLVVALIFARGLPPLVAAVAEQAVRHG